MRCARGHIRLGRQPVASPAVDVPADPFGDALDADGRARFAVLGRQRRYASGTTLFLEGDHGTTVLVIWSGRVKVRKETADGHEMVLALRGPGALVGELAALDDGVARRSATLVALTPVVVQVIPNDDFIAFLEQHPRALLALTRIIIGRLHDADRRRVEFGAYDTLGRVARVLAELLVTSGRAADGEVILEPSLSQHELAGLVGASRESVVRALGELRRRGLISTGRRQLVVRDVAGLAQLTR
jgi:CRP/FNR family cyclic AMP-dependent transcriptional regulator